MSKRNRIIVKAYFLCLLIVGAIIFLLTVAIPEIKEPGYNRFMSFVWHIMAIIAGIYTLVKVIDWSISDLKIAKIQDKHPNLIFEQIESESLSLLRGKLKQTSDIVVEKIDDMFIVFYSDEAFAQENLLEFSETENIFVFTFEDRKISIKK